MHEIKSNKLFRELCEDAEDWRGIPMWGANVGGTQEDSEDLEELKQRGLVKITEDEDDGCKWVHFTDAGREYSLDLFGFDPNPTGNTSVE